MQRTYIFLVASLCIISIFNNQLFSADRENPLLYSDTNQHIFEYGTAETNRALRCTCKILNAACAKYRTEQAHEFNEKFKNVERLTLPIQRTFDYFPPSSVILLPDGKSYSVQKHFCHVMNKLPMRCILTMQ